MKGIEFSTERINEAGGIDCLGGAKIRLIKADTEGDPTVGMSQAEKLITVDNVPVIVGAYQSAVTHPTTQVAEQHGIPYLVESAIADDITARGFDNVFRPHTPTAAWTAIQFEFLDYLREQHPDVSLNTLGLLYEDTLYGQASAESWKEKASDFGWEIVVDLPYPANAPDLTSEISRLKAAEPDVVMIVCYISDAILIARTMDELDFRSAKVLMGTGGGYNDWKQLYDNVGELADGIFTPGTGPDLDIPALREIQPEYVEWSGDEALTGHASQGVHTPYILKAVLEKACSTDPAAIREAFQTIHIDYDPHDPIFTQTYEYLEFDEQGENPGAVQPMTQLFDGTQNTVYPEMFKQADYVFPHPWPQD
jgi:branched-chain amino acid transport system substrate-binding protein